jgi:hypothetical protein
MCKTGRNKLFYSIIGEECYLFIERTLQVFFDRDILIMFCLNRVVKKKYRLPLVVFHLNFYQRMLSIACAIPTAKETMSKTVRNGI